MRRKSPKAEIPERESPNLILSQSPSSNIEVRAAEIPPFVDRLIESGLHVRGKYAVRTEGGRVDVAAEIEFETPENPWRTFLKALSGLKAELLLKILGMFKSGSPPNSP